LIYYVRKQRIRFESAMIESKLDPWPVHALDATLDLPGLPVETGQEVPYLWHWLYFLNAARRATLGKDGHRINQEWVDPALRRRRLFAAARTEFLRPLRIGSPATMSEKVIATHDKVGRSGPFHVVTVEYHYYQDDKLCIREERDIVYLQGAVQALPAATEGNHGTGADSWSFTLTPDPVMLMRFSALTFNSHLIHFDTLYTQREEGYRERVVHGPLVAIVLARLLPMNQVGKISRFNFRARSPLYVNQPIKFFGVRGEDRIEFKAVGSSGMLAMEATAWLA
jgi:3-methylfumaryl-CoA hydratase